MAKIAVNLTNARELSNKLSRASENLKEIIQTDIDSAVGNGVSVAKSLARVRTGYMRDHIHGESTSTWHWQMRSEATYSSYQDMGTSRIEGTHFMSIGAKTAHDQAINAIREDIRGLLGRLV